MPEQVASRRRTTGRLSPEMRTLQARAAAHAMHAKHDSEQVSRAGRRAFLARFEREVDPNGELPVSERRRRAEHARRAHMTRLALLSAKSRQGRATNHGTEVS